MPNRLFETRLDMTVGRRRVELHHADIHSQDGNLLWLPDERILFAGDTLEDPVTYVTEPDRIAIHLRDLARLRTWPIRHILPNHGDPARIAAGGYDAPLIDATIAYLERLIDPVETARFDGLSLRDVIARDHASGALSYFDAYEAVHARNVAAVREAAATG